MGFKKKKTKCKKSEMKFFNITNDEVFEIELKDFIENTMVNNENQIETPVLSLDRFHLR